MHIVLVSYEFPPVTATGGIGSYMYHLSLILTRSGHKVTVFSANPGAAGVRVAEYTHCINYLIPAANNDSFREQAVTTFTSFLENNKVDLIESPEVGACALYIKEKFPHIPLLVKMHTPGVLITKVNNTYMPLANKIRFVAGALMKGKIDLGHWAKHDKNRDSDVEYRICMMADILLSPSVALKKWAVSYWEIPANIIRVVPNPFSAEEELFLLPLQNRPAIVSFVGKLSVLKGMMAFTKAIPLILRQNKEYKIFLVGRDEVENGQSMQAYMQQQLAEYETRIVFTGALTKEELKKIYASSRVCVFPSLWENYPTVVMEAMAAGVAVAASDAGGITEIITHKVTGVVYDAKQPAQIARAINELLADDAKRLALAKVARNELLKKMNDTTIIKGLLQVYTQFENTATK